MWSYYVGDVDGWVFDSSKNEFLLDFDWVFDQVMFDWVECGIIGVYWYV